MATKISNLTQAFRGLLPERAERAIEGNRTVEVKYVRNATRWSWLGKVGAVIAFPIGLIAAARGSYARRLLVSGGGQPAPIDTGISRTDWKKVLRASRDPGRIDQLASVRQDHLRSVAIKLIGATGQDQGLKAVWRNPDTRTADLVQLAVHCVADTTGDYRKTVFDALRGEVIAANQQPRSERFQAMRAAFTANEASDRAQIGAVQKFDNGAGELLLPLSGAEVQSLGRFKVKPEHFSLIRPLVAELTRMPQGSSEQRAAWLNHTLQTHKDAVRLLVLIPELFTDKTLDELGPLKEMLDKDRPVIDALRQALDIKGLDAKNKALLHSGSTVKALRPFTDLKAEIEKKIKLPVDAARAEAFAHSIDQTVEGYDFSAYTNALANMTEDLPPELSQFFEEVMQRYFSSQTLADKKTMLASLYEHGNSTEPVDHLVALLKGAGPFMQKIVQQLGSQAKSPEIAKALQQLKENLNPIDDEERTVLLADVVRNLDGDKIRMTNIRVLSSASVAETLAVTLEPLEGQAGESREMVVKLLRPGIVERAGRERAFFEQVAAERGARAGGGDALVRTMGSIADQIEAELDLRFEAREIQTAQVYASRPEAVDGGVKVMTMSSVVQPQAEYLILDRMPGRSVKSFIAEMESAARDPATPPARLAVLQAQGEALCQRLVTLNTMWLNESLFDSGFFHGDMHAGNLMIDTPDNGPATLGVIDFGNAATLDPGVQRDFLRLQAAVHQGHPRLAIDALRGLLPPSSRVALDQVRPMLEIELKGIMVKEEAGQLKGDLVGEFLSAATRNGIEIPGTLLQVGRSQGMLIDTFDRAHEALTRVAERAGTQPTISKGALDDASIQAVTGSLRALANKAGVVFGLSVRKPANYQRMYEDTFETSPEFRRLDADLKSRERTLELARAEMIENRDTLYLAVQAWGGGLPVSDNTQWDGWVASLPEDLRPRVDLEFRAAVMVPKHIPTAEGWAKYAPLLRYVNPASVTALGMFQDSNAQVRALEPQCRKLTVSMVVDAVIQAERDKRNPRVDVPVAQPRPAREGIGQGLAARLSDRIDSVVGQDAEPQPA